MLGLESYGSDDDESGGQLPPPKIYLTKEPRASSKTETNAPANTGNHIAPASSQSHPKQTVFPRKRTVKIAIEMPKADDDDDNGGSEIQPPVVKKPRTEGAGRSSLLNILPAPKKSIPATPPQDSERVLGGGKSAGLQFRSSSSTNTTPSEALAGLPEDPDGSTTSLLPHSILRGKPVDTQAAEAKRSTPVQSFFPLGGSSKEPLSNNTASTSSAISSVSLSAAPSVPDFTPPEPNEDDPYPGYYQLPSGQWAQYEPEYYRKFWEDRLREWDDVYGNREKGFENAEQDAQDVSAADQMDNAQKLREERKSLTKNTSTGLQKPNMNIEAPKIGSRARYRHQLTALLTEAYDRRDELEEKIAQARRNRKESGNKYGF